MIFYETEVLSIPAGNTIDLIEDDAIGIYECPSEGRGYGAQKKKMLFLSFRAGKSSISTVLYKVADVVRMKFGDEDAIEALAHIDKSYTQRVKNYIAKLPTLDKDQEKRVFFLDFSKSIQLPHPCRPTPGNSGRMPQGAVKYELQQFFQSPKGKFKGKEVVLLSKKVNVDDEELD